MKGRHVYATADTHKAQDHILRLPMTTPLDGEHFFFQLLACNVPARDWSAYNRRDVARSYGLTEAHATWLGTTNTAAAADAETPLPPVAVTANFAALTDEQYWAASLIQNLKNQCVFSGPNSTDGR